MIQSFHTVVIIQSAPPSLPETTIEVDGMAPSWKDNFSIRRLP